MTDTRAEKRTKSHKRHFTIKKRKKRDSVERRVKKKTLFTFSIYAKETGLFFHTFSDLVFLNGTPAFGVHMNIFSISTLGCRALNNKANFIMIAAFDYAFYSMFESCVFVFRMAFLPVDFLAFLSGKLIHPLIWVDLKSPSQFKNFREKIKWKIMEHLLLILFWFMDFLFFFRLA